MTSSDASKKELLERIAALEEENKQLRAKLRWYEGPHTPPSEQQSSADESSSSDDEDDDFLVYYLEAEDLKHILEAYSDSTHDIGAEPKLS